METEGKNQIFPTQLERLVVVEPTHLQKKCAQVKLGIISPRIWLNIKKHIYI